MSISKLLSAFVLTLLFNGQIVLLPNYAIAGCCGCTCMWWTGCYCAGQGGCPYCTTDEADTTKIQAPVDQNSAVTIEKKSMTFVSAETQTMRLRPIAEMRLGKPCLREKSFYAILGDSHVAKFEISHFNDNVWGQKLAFNVSEH
jgi:hypothetical protein